MPWAQFAAYKLCSNTILVLDNLKLYRPFTQGLYVVTPQKENASGMLFEHATEISKSFNITAQR